MGMIPPFDHNHVLPPYTGDDPTSLSDVSPYKCLVSDFCKHFSTTLQRIELLKNFMEFRLRMVPFGIIHGFQWIDGSFSENIEVSEKRCPNDIDVVTFIGGKTIEEQKNIILAFPEFGKPDVSKRTYKLDHYIVDYTYNPNFTVEFTRYWIQLFCHNRSKVWKGIIQLPLPTDGNEERSMLAYLSSVKL